MSHESVEFILAVPSLNRKFWGYLFNSFLVEGLTICWESNIFIINPKDWIRPSGPMVD